MKDTAQRVRISEYAETVAKTVTTNLRLLPVDAKASWSIVYQDAACKAINKMFRSHEGRSDYRIAADDVDEVLQETWAAMLNWFKTGEVRTSPCPPRRPEGTSITKGVRIQDVPPQDVEKWIVTIAKSRADELARKRCPRDQDEEKRRRLLRKDPNGTATFPQSIPTEESLRAAFGLEGPASCDQELFAGDKYAAWEGEPSPDPRTAMSLRPGPLLIFGTTAGLSNGDETSKNELLTSVLDSWRFNSTSHHADKAIVVDDPAHADLAKYYADLSLNYDVYCPQRIDESDADYRARVRPSPIKPDEPVEYAIRRGKCPPMPVRQVTQAEWDRMFVREQNSMGFVRWSPANYTVTLASDKSYRADHPIKSKRKKLDEIEANLASIGMDETSSDGFSIHDNALDPQKPIDLRRLERYTTASTVWLYHRDYKRVKHVRDLSDGLRSWIEVKGERILVNCADLQSKPWAKVSKQTTRLRGSSLILVSNLKGRNAEKRDTRFDEIRSEGPMAISPASARPLLSTGEVPL